MKRCKVCGETKPEEEFPKVTTKSRSGGKEWTYPRLRCKTCDNENSKKRYAANKEKWKPIYRRYYAQNTERFDYWRAKSRARRLGATQFMSEAEWTEVRNAKRCHFCRIELRSGFRTVDHLTPLCEGGQHTVENCVAACCNCNAEREWNRKVVDRSRPTIERRNSG